MESKPNEKTIILLTMKKRCFKILWLVFVMSLTSNTLFAQGTFVNINAGYGFSMSSQNYIDFYNSTFGINSTTDEQVNISLGKGLCFGGAFGYMLNENIGAELGISYLLGGKSKAMDTYIGGTTDYTLSSKMLRINPSVIIASGFEKINPYAKFGVVIGAGSIAYEYHDNDDGDIEILKMKFNGGIAFGLSSGIGALFKWRDKMIFYGELNMINLSYAPEKGELTQATYNGSDRTPYLTTSEREIEFVDSYTYNSNSTPPDSQPSTALKQKQPFGSVGVSIGWRINF